MNDYRKALSAVRALLASLLVLTNSMAGCSSIRAKVENRSEIAPRKLSRLGLEAIHQGRWSAAEENFAAALKLDETDDRAHLGMAETLWHRGQRPQAIEHMQRAVQLSAAQPDLVVRLGRMYLESGNPAAAREQSNEALMCGRELAATWALHGDVLAAEGDDQGALAAYHRALVLQPHYPQVQIAVAEVYQRLGRYDRLLATLDRLQDGVDPSNCPVRAQLLRGLAMKQLGRPREAADCFLHVAQSFPHDTENLILLAESELECGNHDAARKALDRALSIDAQCPGSHAILARLTANNALLPH